MSTSPTSTCIFVNTTIQRLTTSLPYQLTIAQRVGSIKFNYQGKRKGTCSKKNKTRLSLNLMVSHGTTNRHPVTMQQNYLLQGPSPTSKIQYLNILKHIVFYRHDMPMCRTLYTHQPD